MAARIVLAVIIIFLSWAWSVRAEAQQAPPYWQAVSYIYTFKALQLLPDWAGTEDDWRFLNSKDSKRMVVCVKDRATGAQWTTNGDLQRFIAGMQGDASILMNLAETNNVPRPPVVAEDVELCWGKTTISALGESVYRAIIESPIGSPDFAAMERDYRIGSADSRTVCGPPINRPSGSADPTVRWHTSVFSSGITRCKSQTSLPN